MKRLHIHLAVDDLDQNIKFYNTIFSQEPTVRHDDYAKWQLDDPCVNFAISNRSNQLGLDHLGIQVEQAEELDELKQRLDATQQDITTQQQTACCYAESDKHWVTDPQGIAWESFHSLKAIPTFNAAKQPVAETVTMTCTPDGRSSSSCCG